MIRREHINAFPLAWPAGWRRTPPLARKRAQFNRKERRYRAGSMSSYAQSMELTVADAMDRLLQALARMGLERDDIVISTNLQTKLSGLPRLNQPEPNDPGVAVYWLVGGNAHTAGATRCMAIDRYDSVAGNLAAIAATLEALRAIERHGGAEILDRAFTGFVALPQPEQWWSVLGVSMSATIPEIDAAYRKLAAQHHPDRGGRHEDMVRINVARDAGYEARLAP